MIKLNSYFSYNTKKLPPGCQYCIKGQKLVLFITGICPRKCYFCPLSDKKYGKDVIFANERAVTSFQDVVLEVENMRAKGAGITGGDPLAKLDRTVDYITKFKQKYGKRFHIHLYTSLNLVTKKSLQSLFDAGLDEIRFHPDLDSQRFWKNIELAKQFSWDVGMEIPLIPTKEKETKLLFDYVHDKVSFINLNELEVADNETSKLNEMGFVVKDELSYAVKGSLQFGLRMIAYAKLKKYAPAIHLCTAKLKDGVQLANRLKRQGKYSKMVFDSIDREGLLTRGVLYLPKLAPGFGYQKSLESIDKNVFVRKLQSYFDSIQDKLNLPEGHMKIDTLKPRILLSRKMIVKHKDFFLDLGLIPAIVKEYPTADRLEVEIEFLK
jgi:uncharacterized protein